MIRLHRHFPIYVPVDSDNFIEEKAILDLKLSRLQCIEIAAYYSGEEVTADTVLRTHRLITRPGTCLPLDVIEKPHIVIECTDGEHISKYSNSTLRRLFRLFESYISDMYKEDSSDMRISFNYPISVVRDVVDGYSLGGCVINSSNLSLVLQLDPISIRYHSCYNIDLNAAQLEMLITPTLEGLRENWERSIDANAARYGPIGTSLPLIGDIINVTGSLYILPSIARSTLSYQTLIACLVDYHYPSLLFVLLSNSRITTKYSQEALDLLLNSDFDDYHKYKARNDTVVLDAIESLMKRHRETITRDDLLTIMTKLRMNSVLLGNKKARGWCPYRIATITPTLKSLLLELVEQKMPEVNLVALRTDLQV